MKTKILLLFLFFLFLKSTGQVIDPYLISFTGNSISNGSNSLDYSLGEILIETLSDSSFYCTQGLLQPNYNSTIGIVEISRNEVNVYPNPTSDKITIRSSTTLKTEIVNLLGEIIGEYNSNDISIQEFENGIYYLKIFNSKNELIKSQTIIKL